MRTQNLHIGVTAGRISRANFIWPIAIFLAFVLCTGPNPLLAILSSFILVVGVKLLWRPGEPQVLLYLFLYQWLQVTTILIVSRLQGVFVSDLYDGFPALGFASGSALVAIGIQAIGMRVGAGRQQFSHLERAKVILLMVPYYRWLLIHGVALGVSLASLWLASMMPGLSQPLLVLAKLKWATFVIITLATFSRGREFFIPWIFLFAFEFFLSIGGYFSSFKTVFIYSIVAISAVSFRFTVKQLAGYTIFAVVLINVGVYWTLIKSDYRAFVSGGQSAQVVEVSRFEAIGQIFELVSLVTPEQVAFGAERLSRRFSELEVYSASLDYVPSVVPHQGGSLWLESIARPFMPRVFFPNKSIIDESEMSNIYTGIKWAGMSDGAQIAMGYIADSYIDFSEIGMWGVLITLGYCIGRSYRWCAYHRNGNGVFGFGLCTILLLEQVTIGTSSAKLIGSLVVSLLVIVLVLNFITPTMRRWLQ